MTDRFGPVRARPGRFVHGSLVVDGIPLPVVVGAGKEEGPTLLITCAQHPTEFSGPALAHKIITDLDLERLRGTVVILAVTSPLQVMWSRGLETHRDRFNPEELTAIEKTNMNRVWPGRKEGNFIERAAAAIYEELCRKANAIIDFHCCRFADGRFTAAVENHTPSLDLARAFGFPVIDAVTAESYAGGLLHIQAGPDLNIPAILVETYPGDSAVIPETVAACYRGVLNALVHLGMLEGEPVLPTRQTVFRRADPVLKLTAETTGFLCTLKAPGEVVEAGDLIATVRNLETFETAQEIRAPKPGGLPSVGPASGNWLVTSGEEVATLKRVHQIIENRRETPR